MGSTIEIYLETAAGPMVAQRPTGHGELQIGDRVSLAIDPASVVVFPEGAAH